MIEADSPRDPVSSHLRDLRRNMQHLSFPSLIVRRPAPTGSRSRVRQSSTDTRRCISSTVLRRRLRDHDSLRHLGIVFASWVLARLSRRLDFKDTDEAILARCSHNIIPSDITWRPRNIPHQAPMTLQLSREIQFLRARRAKRDIM